MLRLFCLRPACPSSPCRVARPLRRIRRGSASRCSPLPVRRVGAARGRRARRSSRSAVSVTGLPFGAATRRCVCGLARLCQAPVCAVGSCRSRCSRSGSRFLAAVRWRRESVVFLALVLLRCAAFLPLAARPPLPRLCSFGASCARCPLPVPSPAFVRSARGRGLAYAPCCRSAVGLVRVGGLLSRATR